MNNKLKSERGSVTIFILASCLFFLMSTIGVQGYIKNKQSALEKDYRQVKESYEKDIDNQEKIYNKLKDVSKSGNITVSFEIQDGYLIPTGANSVNILQKFTIDNGTNKEIRQISYGWSNSTSSEPEEWTSLPTNNLTCLVSKDDAVVGDYYLWVKVVDEDAHEETVHMQNAITVYNQEITIAKSGENAIITYPSSITMYNKKVGQGLSGNLAETNKVNNSNSSVTISSDYFYVEATDSHGNKVLKNINKSLIDNIRSLVLGFVDDLGTRATIYLYGNVDKQVNTSITTTLTESPTGSTVVNYNSQPIIVTPSYETNLTSEDNYVAYTVDKNGTYKFRAAAEGQEATEIPIVVRNIETFTAIDAKALSSKTEAVTRSNTTTIIAYKYKETNDKFAYVPAGYYVDTNSNIDTGLVITDNVDANGYSTGNEWVWVPVNSTVGNNDIKVTESGTVNGATSVSYTKYAKLYSFSQARTRDAYGTFYPSGNSTTKTLGKPSETSGYREPSLLTDGIYGDNKNITSIAKRAGGNFASGQIANVATQYITDYNSMVTSVETYGGFYIGRYELANISGTAKEQPGTSYTNETWFSLYNKCLNLNKSGTATETSMMYGSLWDATMQWLSSSYDVGYTGKTYSGYGNYKNAPITVSNNTTTITVKPSGTSTKLSTGQTSHTKSNNIYDLSGNCYDWTQEAYDAIYRALRGGGCFSVGSIYTYSAYRSGSYPTSSYDDHSSRPQLYIK